MRLIFLYTSWGPGSSDMKPDVNNESLNRFATGFAEEGYYWIIRRMVETGIVDDAVVFVESVNDCGFRHYGDKIKCIVAPSLNHLNHYMTKDAVIWARGGFRGWWDWLNDEAKNRWMLLYGANTGREKWRFWDIIFNDLAGRNWIDPVGRVHLDFRKPTRPDFFKFIPDEEPKWDLCIGASRVHDKKGQWKAIDVLIAYQKKFGKPIRAILPGPWTDNLRTREILKKIEKHRLAVDVPDNLARPQLSIVMNRSKIFIHLGGGQGDRGVMEAMRSGCHLVIGSPGHHAPFVCSDRSLCFVPRDPSDPDEIASGIDGILSKWAQASRKKMFQYHESKAGIESIVVPFMREIFDFIRRDPERSRKAELPDLINHFFKRRDNGSIKT